jgi:tRNA A-37 threonylcarbamoyl transferase component Bud32
MEPSSFKKVSKGGMRGWVRKDIFNLLPPSFFEDPVSFVQELGGEVIKDSRLRWAAIFTLSNGQRIFLKRDRSKAWIESMKYFILPSKAQKEWFIAYQFQKRYLNIPKPLGWIEKRHRGFLKESYYLSETIGSGVSFIEDSMRLRDPFSLLELAKVVKNIHDAGLFHKDLHGGNFLWDGESFFLTDLHRAKIVKSLSLSQRLWNLSQLFHSLRSTWEEKDQIQFIEKYFEKEPLYFRKKEEMLQKIHSLMDRLQMRQWKSRTKRCLKESTEFSIKKEKGVQYYHRRDFSLDCLKRVIEEHQYLVREKPFSLVKNSPKVIVSLLNDGENKVCVKQFCYPHFWDCFKELFRHSKGLKSWMGGNGLRVRRIPSLLPLGFVEKRSGLGLMESFLVMKTSEVEKELDRYILKGFEDFREKRLFIKTFAQWLSHFHKMDLYHKDMKTCNIMVSENGETWDFHLLDLEDIELDEKVDEKKLFKNFLQLNTSTPKIITRADRLRFVREYFNFRPVIKNRKYFLNQLVIESRRMGFIYVSPNGVVIEKMF